MPEAFVVAAKLWLAKVVVSYGTVTIYYSTVIKAAIFIAASASAAASARSAKKAARRGGLDQGRMIMIRQAAAPRDIVYGTVRKSGVLVFAHVTGSANEFVHLVIAVASHQVQEIGDIYIDDVIIPLDGSGDVTSGKYAGFVRVKKHLGTDAQVADATLVSEASSVWTSNHRLRGIAYVYVRLKYNQDVFPGGIPNVSMIIQGRLVLDTRTSVTAYSANWALCQRDYMSYAKLGLGVPDAEFDTTALNAAANEADEDVPLNPSGNEKRYTMNGVVSTDALPGDVIELMATAGSGFVGYMGGKWVIHAGSYRTPTITLDENDLRGSISVQTKASRRDIFNGIKGLYTSPDNQWQTADFPPVVNSTYTTEDGGTRIWQDTELPFTTSHATAQRLGKILLERVRQQIIVRMPCKLTALRVQAGDNVMVTNTRLGWTAKVFEVQSFSFVPEPMGNGATGLGVDLILKETASGVWDWDDGEETTVDPAPNTTLPNPFVVAPPTSFTAVSNSATTSLQTDGTVIPRLKLDWTAPDDIHVTSGGVIRIEYKASAASLWTPSNVVRGDVVQDFIEAIVIGVVYNVRIRSENGLRVTSAWVEVTVTASGDTAAPTAPTGLAGIGGAGFITLDWADNTEIDLSEYAVYRNTVDNFGSAVQLAEVMASRFVDTGMTTGTTYYYWVVSIDRSENRSTQSNVATAASTAPNDITPPSTPSAPTYSSEGTYLSGDGTVFAFVVISTPALPAGAIVLDVLYRVNGSASWIIADQVDAAGTSRIDDLSPNVAYQFAVRGVSNGGALSADSGVLSRTAPDDGSIPANATGLSSSVDFATYGFPPARFSSGTYGQLLPVAWFFPGAIPALDVDRFEVYVNTFAFPPSNADPINTGIVRSASLEKLAIYTATAFTLNMHVWCRWWDRSGNSSAAWATIGPILNSVAYAGNLAAQNASAVDITGLEVGNGSSVRKVLARFEDSAVEAVAGGAPTETITMSLTNRGFGTKADVGTIQCATDDNIVCAYDFDNASNSSSIAYVKLRTVNGSNLPAGNQRFSAVFVEYD